jgi:predicted ATPase
VKSTILELPVLVGRENELEELQKALNNATMGKGGTVFVAGEAGSGKTRLTTEFLELARKKDVRILTGWCLSNAPVPYFPFVEAFDSLLGSENSSGSMFPQQMGLKSWLRGTDFASQNETFENVSPQVWKEQMFASVAKELLLLATTETTVLVLEDIHWADSASLSLLHYISRAVTSERILILATYRKEEVGVITEGHPHPLLNTLRLMGREDLFKEIRLSNLTVAQVGRLLESMLSGSVNTELSVKLAEESLGNPLFLVESVRMLFEQGNLIQDCGKWRLAIDRLEIPLKVKDIILRRLSELNSEQRRILDIASVIGDVFDPSLLGAVLKQDSLEVLETLNSIAVSKSLVCVKGDCYAFDHAKSREVIYDEILLPLKKGYHERVAERIENLCQDRPLPLSDLAYHFTKAGNKTKSIEYSLVAGKDALKRFSNAEAIKLFTYVLENSESQALLNERNEALEGLGFALVESGLQSQSIRVLEQLYKSAKSDLTRIRALRKAMWAATYQGDLSVVQDLAVKAKD